MTNPLVSIGIPFYNSEKTLSDAIKSIFAQTFRDWELILVDDGSSDKSLKIAQSVSDQRVIVISDGQNKKLPARLNQIVDVARGKYIARMDADDLCFPERIERQLELFEKDPDLDVVGTGMVYLGDNDVPLGITLAPTSHSEICKEPYRIIWLFHPTTVAKKSWCEKNRYDESIPQAQDFNLWLRAYAHSKFANVPNALYFYRCEYSFNHKKRLKDRYFCANFLFKHYFAKKQFLMAFYAAIMQYIKLVVGFAICVIWSKRRLIERRYQPFDGDEAEPYREEIRRIKDVKLPVLD
jgi:glycosyltransferase involved in cell wall biosynthesis